MLVEGSNFRSTDSTMPRLMNSEGFVRREDNGFTNSQWVALYRPSQNISRATTARAITTPATFAAFFQKSLFIGSSAISPVRA
jgi:hypothetical protein